MVELYDVYIDNLYFEAVQMRASPHLYYLTGVSHFLVMIHAGQKFVSPAISGITPR